jgi:hypothetical protein
MLTKSSIGSSANRFRWGGGAVAALSVYLIYSNWGQWTEG